MPQTALSRIVRTAAPAAVRLIAVAAVVLGRPPHHTEAGVSQATWYRHRTQGLALAGFDVSQDENSTASEDSQAEKNQERSRSHAENLPPVIHRAVDKSAELSTALAREKASCDQPVANGSPRKHHLSTGQKKKSTNQPEKKSSADAPFCRDTHGASRSVIAHLRADWLKAREREPGLPPLALHRDAVEALRERIREDGAPRVLEVARATLAAAERGEVPQVFWARLFVGKGYAARSAALEQAGAAERARAKLLAKALRPLTDVERRILGRVSA